MIYKVYTLNIGNPSIQRAKNQVEYLKSLDCDIYVLTETKKSVGCDYIFYSFLDNGYHVIHNIIGKNSLGTMIISKYKLDNIKYRCIDGMRDLMISRLILAKVQFSPSRFLIIAGVYVPSRDRSEIKITRKSNFLNEFFETVSQNDISLILGDFNIISRSHIPKYNTFYSWEYDFYKNLSSIFTDVHSHLKGCQSGHTWIGRTGDGYRYDYVFANKRSIENITDIFYDDSSIKHGLSDHKAIKVILRLD